MKKYVVQEEESETVSNEEDSDDAYAFTEPMEKFYAEGSDGFGYSTTRSLGKPYAMVSDNESGYATPKPATSAYANILEEGVPYSTTLSPPEEVLSHSKPYCFAY